MDATLLLGVNTTAGRALDVVFPEDACAAEESSGSIVCSNGVFVLIVGEAIVVKTYDVASLRLGVVVFVRFT